MVDGGMERVVKLSEEDLAHWRRTGGGMKEKLQSIDWKNLSYVSITLVVINVIVFLVSENDGGRLLEAGTLNIEGVLKNKEYARFVWYMFLHGGIEHIFNNMVMLYFMGTMIEKEIGHLPYLVIYFLSGIGGGMFSLYMKVRLMNPVGSVGASAAIFGLDGLLLSMVLFYRRPMPQVTPVRVLLMIALSLYNGFMSDNVDNAGHVGGLLVGLLFGALFCHIRRFRRGENG